MASPRSFFLFGDCGPQGHDRDDQQGGNRNEVVRWMFDSDDTSWLSRICPDLKLDSSPTDEQLWLAQYIVTFALDQQKRELRQYRHLMPMADRKYNEAKHFAKEARIFNMFELDSTNEQFVTYNPLPGVGGPDWAWHQATLLEKGLKREEVEKCLSQFALEVGKVGYLVPGDIFYMTEFAIPLKERPGLWQKAQRLGIKIRRFGGPGAEAMARTQNDRVRIADLHANLRRFGENVQWPSSEMLGCQTKGAVQVEEERKIFLENMAVVRQLDEGYEREQEELRAAKYKKLREQQQQHLEQSPDTKTGRPTDATDLSVRSTAFPTTSQPRFLPPMGIISSGMATSSFTLPSTTIAATAARVRSRLEPTTNHLAHGHLHPTPPTPSAPWSTSTAPIIVSSSSLAKPPTAEQPSSARVAAAARGHPLPVHGPSDIALNALARAQAVTRNGRVAAGKFASASEADREDHWMRTVSDRVLRARDALPAHQRRRRESKLRRQRERLRELQQHQQALRRQSQYQQLQHRQGPYTEGQRFGRIEQDGEDRYYLGGIVHSIEDEMRGDTPGTEDVESEMLLDRP